MVPMKPMTTTRRWILRIILGIVLAAFVTMIVAFHVDYSEYKAFRRAIKSEGFEIQKRWIYEEDFVLEDFGIYAEKSGLGFWLDVRNLGNVRSPDARIEGILLESLHEGWENNQRAIAFNSDFWREKRLPAITTPKEFLAHAHTILPSIYHSKASIQKTKGGISTYENFLIIRDDPSDKTPVTKEFVEDAD